MPPFQPHRRAARLATLTLPLALSSCFTMALWGFSPTTEPDPVTGAPETAYEYQEGTEWSWSLFGLRLLATPLTFALDLVTYPVQVFFLGDEDPPSCPETGISRPQR